MCGLGNADKASQPVTRTVLNLFSYTCGFGLAAAIGGAVRTVNVDNKGGCLSSGKSNYKATLGGFGVDYKVDERSFSKECSLAALSRLSQLSASTALYDLVVVDPPPRFHQKSRIHFEAEKDYGHLLAQCFRATAGPGSHVLAGLNALTVSDKLFAAMVEEAAASTGMRLTRVQEVGSGPDFEPPCPFRPTARFVLLRRET
jgi:23S rRNA (cytosine1962-C5)-methyltransferase